MQGNASSTFLCTPLDENYPPEIHFANYYWSMLTDSHGLGTPNFGGYRYGFYALSSESSASMLGSSNFRGYGYRFGALTYNIYIIFITK